MKFAVLLYKDVEPIDLGAVTGVLSMAKRIESSIELITIAEEPGQVNLANGVKVIADHGFDNAPDFDVLVVTGGPGWSDQCSNQLIKNFISLRSENCQVVSVCTGAMIVACTGLLDGKKVTTRRLSAQSEKSPLELIEHYAPTAVPVEAAVVESEGVISGGGVTLAIDVMFYLLEKYFGEMTRNKVATLMEYDRALVANEQRLGIIQI